MTKCVRQHKVVKGGKLQKSESSLICVIIAEGSEKYKAVNNNIKRCMKKAKENWIGEQCSETEENLRKNWWETWPLWHRGKRLLSKVVQENASQKSDRYWTDGQKTALSCTTTRPMEIHQYWTVPRQTQRMTTPYFAEKWRLQYNHWRKGSQLESTTSQQNWFKQMERIQSPLSRQSTTGFRRQQASEQEGVPQSRSSIYAFYVRNISSTSKTSTMSS